MCRPLSAFLPTAMTPSIRRANQWVQSEFRQSAQARLCLYCGRRSWLSLAATAAVLAAGDIASVGQGASKLYAAPPAMRIVAIAGTILLVFTAINLVYHVLRKPTEIFVLVNGALNKAPAETWRRYAALFREYSTAAITPELLAALAQVEGAGNPVARTYWRWRLSWNPFALYQPASSGVGMYQMTYAAFAEARPFCIRNHVVVEDACWFSGLYTRVLPSHAIELTAVYLDRNLGAILAGRPNAKLNAQHKQELAAIIHLCGAGAAKARSA